MHIAKLLNLLLGLIGLAILYLGLNIGLGGILTLGWQTPQDFLTVTDPATFQIQDNHIRFIGGVWFGIGLLFLLGAFFLPKLRNALTTLCFIIAIASLFRLSTPQTEVLISGAILPSLLIELFGFPLLGLWLHKSKTRPN